MAKKSYEVDMLNGNIMLSMIRFSIPLMLSSVLQLLFNAADMIVAGKYAGSTSLAAVGSTGAITNLIVTVFLGLSVGTNVVTAREIGSGNYEKVSAAVHTSVTLSLIGGVCLAVIGVLITRPVLIAMDTPEDVLDKSVLYMGIIFLGMPVSMLYNFGSAIMRAMGDTRRPLYFLVISGVINVILNLFFVISLKMDVAGVAIATVISQGISAFLIVLCLIRETGPCHLDRKKLRINKEVLGEMMRIGLPAGLQGAVFSISNVLIQSSVNSFGSVAMAGNTAASNIEGFMYVIMNAVYQTAISFSSQNCGARRYDRVRKITYQSVLLVTVLGIVTGIVVYAFQVQLLSFYTSDEEVIRYGMLRIGVIAPTYFTCGIMDTMVGNLRGLGYSVLPMVVSIVGVCGFRIAWIYTVFAQRHDLVILYDSYPISWVITAAIHSICYIVVWKKLQKRLKAGSAA